MKLQPIDTDAESGALRSDPAPQRAAQAAIGAARDLWQARPQTAGMLADLAAFGTSRALAECAALSELFDDMDPAAPRLAAAFCADLGTALAAQPLAHVPLRHFTDGTISTLLLAQRGPVTLSLVAIDGAGLARTPAPLSVSFSPCEQWEHILAGSARADLIDCRPPGAPQARLHAKAIALTAGKIVARDCSRQALVLRQIDGCLVSLRMQRRRPGSAPTREYELASGAMIHQASGNPRDSRFELMFALLGRMGRTDAAALLAEIACEPGGEGMRWQALRECLALDSGTGLRALSAVAGQATDPLAAPAAALCAQLLAQHPQLGEFA